MDKLHPSPKFRPATWSFGDLAAEAGRALASRRDLAAGLLLGAFFFLFLALIQFSTADLPDNDGFYHIKLAYLMRTEGLKPAFPWLPLSILNPREFYDHHFLFHAALMPFTFGDLRLGAKWAAVGFATLAFLSAWILLKNQRIPLAALWALGLAAVSEAFLYRMSITRAQSLSLAVLMIALDWLLRKKYTRLAGLGFVYVWLYDAFPLLLAVAGAYVLAGWVVEKRLDLRPLLFTGLGTALGLLINPYFPHNIVFAVRHILPKLTEATAISVGNEWYPYDTAQLLDNSFLALAAFLGGALALGLSGKRMDRRTLLLFSLAALFGLMLFQARRFVEYFPAFSLLFAAFAWSPLLEAAARETEPASGEPKPRKRRWSFTPARWGAVALLLALVPGLWSSYNGARESLLRSKPHQKYALASAWLAENTPAGARVFQTDWDDFPRLFFYNTHNTYLAGLDPTYLLLYDEELYHLWVDITRGEVERPSAPILEEFGARYVISDLQHGDFLDQAGSDPGLVEVYRDEYAAVFQVMNEEAAE